MNEQTFKLLEKALLASPGDWETRAHLIDACLAAGATARAAELLAAAPAIPATEEDRLRVARVQLLTAPEQALATLQAVLAQNRACAPAYLLLARLFLQRGQKEEARRKYGAATVIDETVRDLALERELGLEPVASPTADLEPPPTPSAEPVPISATEIESALRALDEPEKADAPRTTFADIGGMTGVIERIRMSIIYPFRNPEVFRKFKKKPGGGILVYGPPGCGKTHLARATAGECGASFISIAITDILSKWLGESEQRLHRHFEEARRLAPSVIFIDEVDAIGVSRAEAGSALAPLVNVFLTEMDGLSTQNENILVLAATNAPWRVDSALRRPGRFDRALFVPPPDRPARRAILEIHLRDLPAETLDLDKIAQMTDRFSGADLRAVVERASEKAIYEEMRSGRAGAITQKLLQETVKTMRPSTVEWLETARDYAAYSNRGGIYDELVEYFNQS